MSRIDAILDDLTLQQRAAAIQPGAVLVLAGAGTGKTKTLTRAVAHRIEARGIPAARILAVTFTNKAAAEMASRIRATLGDEAAPTRRSATAPCARPIRQDGSAYHYMNTSSPAASSDCARAGWPPSCAAAS